jgi:hypothetical protein
MMRTDGRREVARSTRAAVIGLAAVGACVLLALAAAAVGVHEFSRAAPPPVPAQPARRPPPPRVEAPPGSDLAVVERRAAARLTGYGWSDRSTGLAHIPIERAMALRAAQGWADPEPAP